MKMINFIIDNHPIIISALALLGVEISPIKVNPIRFIGRLLGKFLGIQDIRKDISDLRKIVDWNDIDTIRNRISAFDNLVRLDTNKNQLKKYQYITALKDIDKWDAYHERYKNLNGEMNLAIQNINEAYRKATFKD